MQAEQGSTTVPCSMPGRSPACLPYRPLSSRNGKVWTVTPPVLLNGRYPPPATARLLQDSSFLAGLLASLPGVNPTAPVITSVVTALQGHDVVVQDAKALAE